MTDAIPRVFYFVIRPIMPKIHMMVPGVLFNFVPHSKHERSDHIPRADRNAMQARDAGTPDEIDQEGFSLVAEMMCRCHYLIAVFRSDLFKPVIAEFPGCHLDGDPFKFCHFQGAKPCRVEWNIHARCYFLDELFVVVTLSSSKAKVAMGNSKMVTGLTDQVSHDHGIHSSTNGEQHRFAGVE